MRISYIVRRGSSMDMAVLRPHGSGSLPPIRVDLPLSIHYMWVTKRLLNGLIVNPEGWPENSPMWSSTIAGVIPRCHRHLTPKYRQLVDEAAAAKRVHHLRSPRQMRAFLDAIKQEYRGD